MSIFWDLNDAMSSFKYDDLNNFLQLAECKILEGNNLVESLSKIDYIEGVKKLQRKIQKEVKFLNKVKTSGKLTVNHVLCSNLVHYAFLVKIIFQTQDVKFIDQKFPSKNQDLRVDIVSHGGAYWIKVIARNTKSMLDVVKGLGNYGSKSILDHADEFISVAKENEYMFKPPKVIFCFLYEIDKTLQEALNLRGVDIAIQSTEGFIDFKMESQPIPWNFLNLDISSMIAYVSSLTNGSKMWIFEDKILSDQAIRERKAPVKIMLDNIFKEKILICCETAKKSFNEIISTLGGSNEKQRAIQLLQRITVLPDIENLPEKFLNLQGQKIKHRSSQIFAFGIVNKAVTVTSNEGFIRSARMQGLEIPVIIHQARALTECKERTARKIIA